jgi:hypothetical protein
MEGAIKIFPDGFGIQMKLSLFVPLVLPSPQDSAEEQGVIAVPKEICHSGYFKRVALLAAAEGSRRALLCSS